MIIAELLLQGCYVIKWIDVWRVLETVSGPQCSTNVGYYYYFSDLPSDSKIKYQAFSVKSENRNSNSSPWNSSCAVVGVILHSLHDYHSL